MNTELFARNLRAIRKARGISQTEVAKRLFVTPQTVSKWENGNALPDVTNLCHLSELLQTTPNRLLGVGETHDRVFLGIDSGGT
ncbi:MAG: helix-turn-helix transcriptional regulator, partial [Clostridia bacterium]|nr:helix-turn-helix transcriptional regulator [Clostridia bacterium]